MLSPKRIPRAKEGRSMESSLRELKVKAAGDSRTKLGNTSGTGQVTGCWKNSWTTCQTSAESEPVAADAVRARFMQD